MIRDNLKVMLKKVNIQLLITLLMIFSIDNIYARDLVVDGNLSVGKDEGLGIGEGKRLNFLGALSGSDDLSIYRFNRSSNISDLRINIGDDYGSGDDRLVIGTTNWKDSKYYVHMVVGAGGKVGIGAENFGEERLAVNGSIRAREIRVDNGTWADFVFDKEYKLTPLLDLEKFIKSNHHLPEIPSAQEVKEQGVMLGEMNKLLLQKIEELTLHIINQQKQIDKLQQQVIKR